MRKHGKAVFGGRLSLSFSGVNRRKTAGRDGEGQYMELWRFEWKKLWKNRIVTGLIFGCFILNILLLFWQTGRYDAAGRCFPDSIKKVYQELSCISGEKQKEWLKDEIKKTDRMGEEFSASKGMAPEAVYERKNALNYVFAHVTDANQYEAYLQEMKKQAKRISSSSLFSEEDLFSKRNAELIPEKYDHLKGLILKPENSQGVRLAVETKTTDLFLAAIVFLLSYFFICMEREEGTMAFAGTAKYGGKRLGKIKIGLILAGSLLGVLFLYAGNFLTAQSVYGFGSFGRWIQSVDGYLKSPWKISVGAYLIWFLIGKAAAALVLSAASIWIALHGKSVLRTSAAFLFLMALEYGLSVNMFPGFFWNLLRWCNLFSFLRTERFFQSYETVNVFGHPVFSMHICLFAAGLLFLFAVWSCIRSYERVSRNRYAKLSGRKRFRRKKVLKGGHSLLYYEGYKIFFTGGAGFVAAVYLLLQFFSCSGERAYFTLDELYYKNYIGKLEGEVTREKIDFIEAEGQRIFGIEQKLSELERDAAGNLERTEGLRRQLSCKTAYERILSQAEGIGETGVFLDEVGYTYLLGKERQAHQMEELLLVWVLAFHGAFVMEETARATALLHSVSYGRRQVRRKKWALLIACVTFVCTAADLMSAGYRMKEQGILDLGAALRYLPGFEQWGGISAGGYLAGMCAFKILMGICLCGVIFLSSKRAKNAVVSLLLSGSAAGALYLGIWVLW